MDHSRKTDITRAEPRSDLRLPRLPHQLRRTLGLLITVLIALLGVVPGAEAATASVRNTSAHNGVARSESTLAAADWQATIDGHDVSTANSSSPIPLTAGRDARVLLSVTNPGSDAVTIRTLRLEGRVLGMSFFAFSTRIDLDVAAGATEQRTIQLDLSDLGDQAVGLIPGQLSLLGADRTVISQRSLATDVRGSLHSAYGIFGLAVALVTLVLILSLAVEIARHQLPLNRWRRAVRFLAPGVGIGLTATFTLSATRILIPSATVWVPLVLGCGVVAFLIGYLTPTPDHEDAYQDEDYDYRSRSGPVRTALPAAVDVRDPAAPALEPGGQFRRQQLP